ncbi:MAG TPA: isocitrate/isopropylmalate family dehydrogenase, partial [Vicinamibacteria bacterium]|nr:isocitrate/isopropylmalate family dehydrogenase [Vicinamibacteria bacterium]
MPKSYEVTLIPGDGIGPEVAAAAVRVLSATGIDFEWHTVMAGAEAAGREGNPLPPAVLESIRRTKIALKGPTATPIGTGHRSVNVALRKTLDLYAQARPCKTYAGVRSRYSDVDVVIIRENTEDLYAGIEFEEGTEHCRDLIRMIEQLSGARIKPDSGISIKPISITGTERIVRFAFEY